MSRLGSRVDPNARSKSLMRYNELERERSQRRQHVVKQKTGTSLFPSFKLSMMNSGIIPLKKGRFSGHLKHRLVSFDLIS